LSSHVARAPSLSSLSLHDALPISGLGISFQPRLPSGLGISFQPALPSPVLSPVPSPVPIPPLRSRREPSGPESGAGGCLGTGERSEEHTSELQSRENLVCRLLLEK